MLQGLETIVKISNFSLRFTAGDTDTCLAGWPLLCRAFRIKTLCVRVPLSLAYVTDKLYTPDLT